MARRYPRAFNRWKSMSMVVLLLSLSCGQAWAQISVSSALSVELTAAPGDALWVPITVNNLSDGPQRVTLTLVDAGVERDGLALANRHSHPRSLLRWLDVAQEIVLAPRETLEVPVRVRVPEGSAAGTHWGVVLVTPDGALTPAGAPDAATMSIREVLQFAVQVVVDIAGAAAPRLHFDHTAITRNSAQALHLSARLRNLGDLWVRAPLVRMELFDAREGLLTAALEQQMGRLYPGSERLVDFMLPMLPPGPYQLVLLAEANELLFATRFDWTLQPAQVAGDR